MSDILKRYEDMDDMSCFYESSMTWNDDLLKWVHEAADEITRLRAIVDKLPKTADGVPVTPGQTIFAIWPHGPIVRCYAKHEAHGPDMVCFGEGSTTVNGLNCGIRVFAVDCYSTREAAEKAKEDTNVE